MPNNANKAKLDTIIGTGLVFVESLKSEMMEAIARQAGNSLGSIDVALAVAREILEANEPVLAQAMSDAQLASWVFGANEVGGRIPLSVIGELPSGALQIPAANVGFSPAYEPAINFPAFEKAVESLIEREIVTREVFDQLADRFKADSFTVAFQESDRQIEEIRDILVDVTAEGQTKQEFKKRIREKLGAEALEPSHIDNVFRTNSQTAYAEGQETVAANPIVSAVLPYARIDAITDGRVRPNHEALEKLGLNGTNVYRADDPFWLLFTPPWGYQCRCSKTFLTIRQAARLGVTEAQQWKETGEDPTSPEHRLDSIPFRPEDGFVGGGAYVQAS